MVKKYKCNYCSQYYSQDELQGSLMCPQCLQDMQPQNYKIFQDDEEQFEDQNYEQQLDEDEIFQDDEEQFEDQNYEQYLDEDEEECQEDNF